MFKRLLAAITAVCLMPACSSTLSGAAAGSRTGRTVRVLQFNLCNSGIAGCYTGRSVSVAAAVIRAERPDVVTLDEVCRADVGVLARALSRARAGVRVVSAFKSAVDRATGGPYRCVDGQPYGIGVVALDAARSERDFGGLYPRQDLGDPEERVWLCVDLPSALLACTTHTASTSAAVALAQCRFFLDMAVPMLRGRTDDAALVLGADLNLRADRSPGSRDCIGKGYRRVDDDALQDVIASRPFTVRSRTVIDMRGATDHPGLLVVLGR